MNKLRRRKCPTDMWMLWLWFFFNKLIGIRLDWPLTFNCTQTMIQCIVKAGEKFQHQMSDINSKRSKPPQLSWLALSHFQHTDQIYWSHATFSSFTCIAITVPLLPSSGKRRKSKYLSLPLLTSIIWRERPPYLLKG